MARQSKAQSDPLAGAVTESILRSQAGEQNFELGAEFIARQRLAGIGSKGQAVNGTIRAAGTEYTVRLWAEDGFLEAECSCGAGSDPVCAHGAAVAIAWLRKETPVRKATAVKRKLELADTREALLALQPARLVDGLMSWAAIDPLLASRLQLLAAASEYPEAVPRAAKELVRAAFPSDSAFQKLRFTNIPVDLAELTRVLEQLLEQGKAFAVLDSVETMLPWVKMRSGIRPYSETVADFLKQMTGIHLRACRLAGLEPEQVAKRYAPLALGPGCEYFYAEYPAYRELMGETGNRIFDQAIRAAWAAEQVRSAALFAPKRFDLRRVVNDLALRTADEKLYSGLIESTRHSPGDYEASLARFQLQLGNVDKAVGYIEQALAQGVLHSEATWDGLMGNFATTCRERARGMVWEWFQQYPEPLLYYWLRKLAEEEGDWDEWGLRVRKFLLDTYEAAKRLPPAEQSENLEDVITARSVLIRLEIEEDRPLEAYRIAREGESWNVVLLALAHALGESHPDESLAIYRRLAFGLKDPWDNYRLIDCLERAREILKKTKGEAEAKRWLDELLEDAPRSSTQLRSAIQSVSARSGRRP